MTDPRPKIACATVAGHFGELVQGRMGPAGPVAVITLPCPVLSVRAECRPGAFALHQPGVEALTRRQAAAFLAHLGLAPRGAFALRIGMPPGGGAGASTAARVALGRAAGITDPARLAAACIATEGASDPLMFAAPGRLLWASRQGRALAALPPLPRMEVVGGFFGAPRRTDPADGCFPDISDLVADWPAATASPEAAARLASRAAERTLALRGPFGDPTADLARHWGALGWAIAHTGSARALIYAPGTVPGALEQGLRRAGFSRITRFRAGGAA